MLLMCRRMALYPSKLISLDQVPAIKGSLDEGDLEEEPKSLRERFLKKEYVKPHYEESGDKIDKDLDGKFNFGDLNSIFEGSSERHSPDIYRQPKPFGGSFNQSVQVKTIRKPDGSLETHKTVRDSQGNEETTITQKFGDKEYTIIKKLDKDGKEETQEIMVNMDENDTAVLQKRDNIEQWSFDAHDNSLFNKFFK